MVSQGMLSVQAGLPGGMQMGKCGRHCSVSAKCESSQIGRRNYTGRGPKESPPQDRGAGLQNIIAAS